MKKELWAKAAQIATSLDSITVKPRETKSSTSLYLHTFGKVGVVKSAAAIQSETCLTGDPLDPNKLSTPNTRVMQSRRNTTPSTAPSCLTCKLCRLHTNYNSIMDCTSLHFCWSFLEQWTQQRLMTPILTLIPRNVKTGKAVNQKN